jgi:hypothetical protein
VVGQAWPQQPAGSPAPNPMAVRDDDRRRAGEVAGGRARRDGARERQRRSWGATVRGARRGEGVQTGRGPGLVQRCSNVYDPSPRPMQQRHSVSESQSILPGYPWPLAVCFLLAARLLPTLPSRASPAVTVTAFSIALRRCMLPVVLCYCRWHKIINGCRSIAKKPAKNVEILNHQLTRLAVELPLRYLTGYSRHLTDYNQF